MAHRIRFNQSSETVDVVEPHGGKATRWRINSLESNYRTLVVAKGNVVRVYEIREWIDNDNCRATLIQSEAR